ncbi:MAG: hypothetical protein JXA58_06915 [Dehalococcoidia bacterium]|nr:hypothetical protein [Dehalococcoidia bacterium]
MRKSGLAIVLAAIVLGGLFPIAATPDKVGADAYSPDQMRPDSISVSSKYPSATGPADTTFMFQFDLLYQLVGISADEAMIDTGRLQTRVFDFELSGPDGWEIFVAESSWQLDKRIKAMQLRALGLPQSMVIVASAPWWENIEPGEYPIELKVTSDELSDTLTLKAIVTAWYGLEVTTIDDRLNAKTTAGSPATVDLKVVNTGSAVLDNIAISSTKPAGVANEQWAVRFEPSSLKNLAPGEEQHVTVSITPPASAISGDYFVTLSLTSKPTLSDYDPSVELRVSIETRPTWVIIGVAIVVLAFGGLLYAFYVLRQR